MKRGRLKLLLALSALALLCRPGSSAEEQANKVAKLGFVGLGDYRVSPRRVTAFWDRLRELGWVEGRNLVVERRWAKGYEQLPDLMNEIVAAQVDVIATWSTPAGLAAKKATSTVPIVNAGMGDPVGLGLAASLAHPGGNLTGLSLGWAQGLPGKWLELLRETVPRLSAVAVFVNPANPNQQAFVAELRTAARAQRLKLHVVEMRGPQAVDAAFEQARRYAQAAVMIGEAMQDRQRATALAAAHRLPTIYTLSDFADAGGLMVYAPDAISMFRRAAEYVDKILRGAKPGDLPIEQPTRYMLVVNLTAAKALGLTFPQSILLRADEVIP